MSWAYDRVETTLSLPEYIALNNQRLKLLQGEVSAKQATLDWPTPEDFGARGNKIKDDTDAVQRAFTAAQADHTKLYLPSSYKISETITASETNEWEIEGRASGNTAQGTTLLWGGAADGTMLQLAGCKYPKARNFTFDGNNTAGIGFQFRNGLTGTPHTQASLFAGYNLVGRNFTGSPGVSFYFGEGDASPGISDITLYDCESWSSNIGIYTDNGGMQAFRMFGGVLIAHSQYGLHAHYAPSGDFNFYDVDFASNTEHIYGESGLNYNMHGSYFEDGVLLHWGNHNGGCVNLTGCTKTQGSGTPNIFTYDGGNLMLNSIGNYYPYSIDMSASAGNNELLVFHSNDQFTTGGWTKGPRVSGLSRKSAGVAQLEVGTSFTVSEGLAQTVASAAASAGLNIPHGTAPTAPVNGDVWTTTAGLYVRVNGVTVGPLS